VRSLILCGIPDYDFEVIFLCGISGLWPLWGHLSLWNTRLWPLWGCLSVWNYWIMIFWGRLSVRNTRLWHLEVIFLHGIVGYDLCKVICLCGIPDYDLLRSFVRAEYQIVTSWGHISVWDSGLWPLWGHFSVWNTRLWSFEVVCPCRIPDCDLLRSYFCMG